MKKILQLLFAILLLTSCNKKRNDLKEYNLNGSVWKIQETYYDAEKKFGSYQTGEKKYSGHSFWIFNEQGNVLEYRSLNQQGITEWTYKNHYNQNQIKTEVIRIENGNINSKYVSIIENDKIKGFALYNEDGIKIETQEFELSGDLIISGKVKNNNGDIISSFENDWKNGFLSKQIYRDSIGNIDYEISFVRNNHNDVINQIYSEKNNSVNDTYKFQYEYDQQNNWIKRIDFDKENKLDQIVLRNIIYFADKTKKRTENDFIGMWFIVDDNHWFEMRSDKKYDYGYSSRIKSSGTWEVNVNENILTFRANDPSNSKKYRFEFEGYQLVLYTIEGKEGLRLEKR